jgi:ATP-dependent RNA helicase HelY
MKLSMPEMPSATLLAALGSYNLLPAIVFLPTRRRCDQAASEAAFTRRDQNSERSEARREFMRRFVEDHPEVRDHRHWDTIIKGAVASHHAGHIPAWKLVIEKLMSAGLLDAIFATSTVAAGVDFPARTVVVTSADARTGSGWKQLSASELQQMTGRAGRRGRDNVGFIIAAPGLHQNPQRIAELLKAPPDPLVSQFRATYSTLLNLLDAYGDFAQVRQIAERSFAYRRTADRIRQLEREQTECEERIKTKLKDMGCDLPLSVALGLERLVSARTRLQDSQPQTRVDILRRWLDEVVQPGRIVGIGRTGKRLVMITHRRGENVMGIREDGQRASFALERIGKVYAPLYPLRGDLIESAFEEVRSKGKELAVAEPRLRDVRLEEADALSVIDQIIDSMVPPHLGDAEKVLCKEALWALMDDSEAIERATKQIQKLHDEVWQPFEQRARVLASFGYLDFEAEKVTERGQWLANLRIDRPLLVGQALENGLLSSLDATRLAAVMAGLAADEDRDYGELELDDALVSTIAQFEDIGFKVATEEWKYGVEPAPELNFSAAGAAARWASGVDWSALVRETRAEEGDLFRMLSRTGESLLQVAGLRKAHPEASRTATVAAVTVLREPVRY